MRIALLSTSFSGGGAAIASTNLAEALENRGHSVLRVSMAGNPSHHFSFVAERLDILLKNGLRRDTLFKVSTGEWGKRGVIKTIRKFAPDVVIIGWINQGLLSLKQIRELSGIAPVVWVMHDMWCFTGICHHSLGCDRYTSACGFCPMLRKPFRGNNDLSHRVWTRKSRLYSDARIRFVAVSSWVENAARCSGLLRDAEVTVIHNIYPLDRFRIADKEQGLIVFGAQYIDNHIKGLDFAIDALNAIDPSSGAHITFFGDIKNKSLLERLKIPYRLAGALSVGGVADLLSRAEVVLNTSLYETFGNTLLEGQASGAVPVAFARGGQTDIIINGENGYLVTFGNTMAMASAINRALNHEITPEQLRQSALTRFNPETTVAAYEKLISEMI